MISPLPPAGEAFDQLKRLVIARTGHFYYQDKDDLLWERVRRRLGARPLDQYLERLLDREFGPDEWSALEAELTIGETYFFRYPEQFAALRQTILPDILDRCRNDRRLRIWSAGCATGAEAYSIAILLHEMLGQRLADWRVTILGTDINEVFLAQAREARFSRWALRTLDSDERKSWFTQDGAAWRLRERYRSMVRFQRGNLLDLLGPSPPLELVDFDLILCRNVLIYFHPRKMAEIAAALIDRLKADGWLLVGHAEPNPEFVRFATAENLPGTAAYRPPRASAAKSPANAPLPLPPPKLEAPAPLKAQNTRHTSAALPRPPAAPPAPATPATSEDAVREIRRRADIGDFEGAAMKCREALEAHPDHPTLHFYAGLVEQAQGRLDHAEDALRRAAYLAPEFVMAHYHLGLVRIARGRTRPGRSSVAAAARLAGTLAVDERLAEGAGLTAGDLREMARVQLDSGTSGA